MKELAGQRVQLMRDVASKMLLMNLKQLANYLNIMYMSDGKKYVMRYANGVWDQTSLFSPIEDCVLLMVNGQVLQRILCTPIDIEPLALGLLFNYGIICKQADVIKFDFDTTQKYVNIALRNSSLKPNQKCTLSHSPKPCTFFPNGNPFTCGESYKIFPAELPITYMAQLKKNAFIYRQRGGVHASAIADSLNILLQFEDVSRRNTLYKLIGECLLREIDPRGKILLTTGRISSDMLLVAAKLGIEVVASHSSPTSQAIANAKYYGLCLAGYVRKDGYIVYSHAEKLGYILE